MVKANNYYKYNFVKYTNEISCITLLSQSDAIISYDVRPERGYLKVIL